MTIFLKARAVPCIALGLQMVATAVQAEVRAEPATPAEPRVINKPASMDIAPAAPVARPEPPAKAETKAEAKAEIKAETRPDEAKAAAPEGKAAAGASQGAVDKVAGDRVVADKVAGDRADGSEVVVAKKLAPPPKPQPTVTIQVDLSQQRMTVSENGATRYTWPISSGRSREYATPTGTFRPQWMAKMWRSRKYDDAPMPNSIFFTGGFAIHATFATGMLGRPASHGCVRLAPANAATLFKLVQSHGMDKTRISVFGAPRFRDPAVAQRRDGGTAPGQMRQASFAPPAGQVLRQRAAAGQLPPHVQGRYVMQEEKPSGLAALFGAKPQMRAVPVVVVKNPPPNYVRVTQQRPVYVYTANGQLVRVR